MPKEDVKLPRVFSVDEITQDHGKQYDQDTKDERRKTKGKRGHKDWGKVNKQATKQRGKGKEKRDEEKKYTRVSAEQHERKSGRKQ